MDFTAITPINEIFTAAFVVGATEFDEDQVEAQNGNLLVFRAESHGRLQLSLVCSADVNGSVYGLVQSGSSIAAAVNSSVSAMPMQINIY